MLATFLRVATAGATIVVASAAIAASDTPSAGGTPVSPSSKASGQPTGKTGSSDPGAAGTPVAPSRDAQPGTGSDADPAKGGKTR